jgi:hypothetical protein
MKKASLLVLLAAVLLDAAGQPSLLRGSENASAAPAAAGGQRAYATRFPLSENPVSENGNWECGKTTGLDWADITTFPGHAYGLESGVTGYDDSTALLTGAWGPNQTAEATVYNAHPNDKLWEEVELRLRSALSPHVATGYEILFSCRRSKLAYQDIVRWDGPLNKFTYLSHKVGAEFGVADGDVVKATMVGNLITVYKNGVVMAQAKDGTFATGRPGMGFFLSGGTGTNRDYGFTSFSATDGE